MGYFDLIANRYDTVRGQEILPDLLKTVEAVAQKGDWIVDVATGTGLFSVPLADHGFNVIAIDANTRMLSCALAKATKRGFNYKAILGKAERLPLPAHSASAIISTNAIHHFNLRDHFRQVQRVLKPGGRYVIFTRFKEQNQRSLWGQLFPDFAVKESRLLSPEDFYRLDREFELLKLEEIEELSFQKPFSPDQMWQAAIQRKYSTFAMYTEKEYKKALAQFKQGLKTWKEKHYLAEIGLLVFRHV